MNMNKNQQTLLCLSLSFEKCPASSSHLLLYQEENLLRVGSETQRFQMSPDQKSDISPPRITLTVVASYICVVAHLHLRKASNLECTTWQKYT